MKYISGHCCTLTISWQLFPVHCIEVIIPSHVCLSGHDPLHCFCSDSQVECSVCVVWMLPLRIVIIKYYIIVLCEILFIAWELMIMVNLIWSFYLGAHDL